MTKKQTLAKMEGKHHDAKPPYSRKGLVIKVGPSGFSEDEVQDAINMVMHGTDPHLAVRLAKQHPE